MLLEVLLGKDRALWNLSHQQLYNHQQFLNLNPKAKCPHFWCFSQGLDQTCLSFRVLELNCLNATNVVFVSCKLIIAHTLRESSL